jgi:hypothetical protein
MLAGELMVVIDDVLAKFGSLSPAEIRQKSYETKPMIEAQRDGERGVILDLDSCRPLPDLSAVANRFNAVRARLPRQETDPEVWSEINDLIDSFAEERQEATAALLD